MHVKYYTLVGYPTAEPTIVVLVPKGRTRYLCYTERGTLPEDIQGLTPRAIREVLRDEWNDWLRKKVNGFAESLDEEQTRRVYEPTASESKGILVDELENKVVDH